VAFVAAGLLLIWIATSSWPFVQSWRFDCASCAMGFVVSKQSWNGLSTDNLENSCACAWGRPALSGIIHQHWLGRLLFYDVSENAFTVSIALFSF